MSIYERSNAIPANRCEWLPDVTARESIDPFVAENFFSGPMLRSLEVNPYAFIRPEWLARTTRFFVLKTKAGGHLVGDRMRAAGRENTVILVNLRMRLPHRAESFGDNYNSVLLLGDLLPKTPDTNVVVITIVMTVLREAVFARQLHSRELCLAGAAIYGFEPSGLQNRVRFDHLKHSDDERRQLDALTRSFGKDRALEIFGSLYVGSRNTLAYLAAQCVRTPPPALRKSNTKKAAKKSSSRSSKSDEESGETLGSEDTEESVEDDSSSEVSIVSADDESVPKNLLDFLNVVISDNEADDGDAEESEESDDAVEPCIDKVPAFVEHRTNELSWMKLAVQKGSVELMYDLVYVGTVAQLLARTSSTTVPRSSLPDGIPCPSEETVTLLHCTEHRLRSEFVGEGAVFVLEEDAAEEESEEPAPPVSAVERRKSVPQKIEESAEDSLLQEWRERPQVPDRTLAYLAHTDISTFTIVELELYASRRLEALFSCKIHGERPALYSKHSGLTRKLRDILGDEGVERQRWHETAGLFVLCCASKDDVRLSQSLMQLEHRWCSLAPEMCEYDPVSHGKDIVQLWSEMPASFDAEEDDAIAFAELLKRICVRWHQFISSEAK